MTDASPPSSRPPGGWWADIDVAPRAAFVGDAETDVCVVGLGGSGLAAVREARALGARVIGVDAGRIANAAAGRNGGLLLGGLADFHHDAVDRFGRSAARALYRHTLDELARMRRDTPDECWWPGSLRIAGDDAERDDCTRMLAQMQDDGLPVEAYDGPAGFGLRFPEDGCTHPVRRVLRLAALAASAGASLHEDTRVLGVTDGEVHLTSGRIRAAAVIVCTDGQLGTLLPAAAARLRQVRLQMLATEPAFDVTVPCPVYARYGYDYWQQLPDGRVFLGGGRDHFEAAEYTRDDVPTAAVQTWLEQRLRNAVGTTAAVSHRWAATVTYTADGLPLADRFDGCWGVGGYSGTGNVIGALCARGVTRRALGETDAFLESLDEARTVARSVPP